jgi:hypothetical protein
MSTLIKSCALQPSSDGMSIGRVGFENDFSVFLPCKCCWVLTTPQSLTEIIGNLNLQDLATTTTNKSKEKAE